MHDRSLPYYDLYLVKDLNNIDPYPLPDDHSFRYYNKGDERYWSEIEVSAGEVPDIGSALNKFNEYYKDKEQELEHRMIFILHNDTPIATITAFYRDDPYDNTIEGDMHWLAIRKEYQGKGLSKPLITKAMNMMKDMGYSKVYVHTQTHTWLACKIYLSLGFKPINLNKDEEEFKKGWEIINNRIIRG